MLQIPSSELYNTALSFFLKGAGDAYVFPVRTDEAERVESMLDCISSDPAGKKQFAVFDTTNGWTVAVRLDLVEIAHILSDPIEGAPEYEVAEPGAVRFHFAAEREMLELAPVQAEEVAVLATDLDAGLETIPRRFISLVDEDEEGVYVGMQHVLLVEMETALVAEGQRIVFGEVER